MDSQRLERPGLWTVEPLDGWAAFDPRWTGEALCNVVDNAVKYAEDGKYLALRLREEDAAVYIELEDHGPGIPSEEREQIFTRAYTGGRGSGLGLAIAKTLALQMGGDIRVLDAEAGGTRFAVTLPKKS